VPTRIQTSRGVYRLSVVGEPERSGATGVLTLSLERADGIERIAFRCVVGASMIDGPVTLEDRLVPWIEGQFEQLREAALKSIRSEGKLLQIEFEGR
jgi:hypothetical protein